MGERVLEPEETVVYVVDDDARVLEALSSLLRSTGRKVVVFQDAAGYLSYSRPDLPGCVILDLEMPGMNGLELQSAVAHEEGPPIIFLTGRGDIPSSVKAMKAGAADFLSKPFDEGELLQMIAAAVDADTKRRTTSHELRSLRAKFALLTPRERDVLPYVVSGYLNKQTAGELGTSEITIRIHRGQIMRKMAAESLADLVRMAERVGIPRLPPYTKR